MNLLEVKNLIVEFPNRRGTLRGLRQKAKDGRMQAVLSGEARDAAALVRLARQVMGGWPGS